MKLIAMKCPACNADLTIEEGRAHCFCQYCGSKILLVNENEHVYIYKHIDEAELKRVESEQIIKTKQLEYEKVKWEEDRVIKRKNRSVKLLVSGVFTFIGAVMLLVTWVIVDPTNIGPEITLGILGANFLIFGLLFLINATEEKNK